jgi:hypothetical protein
MLKYVNTYAYEWVWMQKANRYRMEEWPLTDEIIMKNKRMPL